MLTVCACGHHRLVGSACPSCGSTAGLVGRTAAAALLGLTLGACTTETGQALYGVAMIDEDGDGYPEGSDCDDTNAAVHPGATETPDDGVDSDCDGGDNTTGDSGE